MTDSSNQTLPIDQDIQIYCDFGRHGWSSMIVALGGQVTSFCVSEVFTDLASEMMSICRATIANETVRVALCDEPGGIIVEVVEAKELSEAVLVSVIEVDPSLAGFAETEDGKILVSAQINKKRLIGMLMGELWKTHVGLKEPSYQENRRSFPHKELIALNKLWNESSLGPSFLR